MTMDKKAFSFRGFTPLTLLPLGQAGESALDSGHPRVPRYRLALRALALDRLLSTNPGLAAVFTSNFTN